MKSRYVAYTQLNLGYILDTMADAPLQTFDLPAALEWAKAVTWVELQILSHSEDSQTGTGHVEFKALYKEGKAQFTLHERSRFEKRDGRWLYIGED